MSRRRKATGVQVGEWTRPSWATGTQHTPKGVAHERPVKRPPQPVEGVQAGQRLELVLAQLDEIGLAPGEANTMGIVRSAPLVYVGAFGFAPAQARELAALLVELADLAEAEEPPSVVELADEPAVEELGTDEGDEQTG